MPNHHFLAATFCLFYAGMLFTRLQIANGESCYDITRQNVSSHSARKTALR